MDYTVHRISSVIYTKLSKDTVLYIIVDLISAELLSHFAAPIHSCFNSLECVWVLRANKKATVSCFNPRRPVHKLWLHALNNASSDWHSATNNVEPGLAFG